MSDFEPITCNDYWDLPRNDDRYQSLDSEDHAEMRGLLLGHSIAKADDDHLTLDDGTVIKVVGNEGCGGCSSGWYDLTELNEVPNIVTKVEFEDSPASDYSDDQGSYKIFVYAENRKINLATFEGTDGNGYYGTGYHLIVRRPSPESR